MAEEKKEIVIIDETTIKSKIHYIRNQKGKHFDPELVDIFISNIEGILDID